MEVEKAVGWDSEESGRTEPKTAQLSASADARGNQAGNADAKEVRGRPAAGIPESVSIRIHAQLWMFQEDGEPGASLEEKGEETAEQTLQTGRIPRPESADRREVRSQLLRGGRQQVLPVHSQGRMLSLDIP